MSLVQYSDSDTASDSDLDESHATPPRPAKKKPRQTATTPTSSLPPLPTTFFDLYVTSTRVSVQDDPSLHGGRKRVIPHVEGNWPTHLYLEWFPSKPELSILEEILNQAESKPRSTSRSSDFVINSLLRSDLGAQLPLHISLSRPVVLRTEQRQDFLETYQDAVQGSNLNSFAITLGRLDWVSNYEQTRWFLVLHAQKPPNNGLNALLGLSNRSLASFGQPPLYEKTGLESSPETDRIGTPEPRRQQQQQQQQQRKNAKLPTVMGDYSHCFHISLAWSLTEPSEEAKERLAKIDLASLQGREVRFDCVKAKIGNNITSIPLERGATEQKGAGDYRGLY